MVYGLWPAYPNNPNNSVARWVDMSSGWYAAVKVGPNLMRGDRGVPSSVKSKGFSGPVMGRDGDKAPHKCGCATLRRRPLGAWAAHGSGRVPAEVSRLDSLRVLANDLAPETTFRNPSTAFTHATAWSHRVQMPCCSLIHLLPRSVLVAPQFRQGDHDDDLEPADDGHLHHPAHSVMQLCKIQHPSGSNRLQARLLFETCSFTHLCTGLAPTSDLRTPCATDCQHPACVAAFRGSAESVG